ncbi:optic atrophy 3-like protein, partial [Microthyrium microscopicum]
MSLTLKLGSLAIRTLAKPLGNYIKRNAREHERFRKFCITFAQGLHRIDMRLRLGLLQDPAVIEKQIARELADAEARLKAASVPTVKTEAQTKWTEERLQKEKKKIEEHARRPPRVRPLSEAKAIETGANFISEGFLFCVGMSVIVFEYWRSRRKEGNRRDEVQERLDELAADEAELKERLATMQ